MKRLIWGMVLLLSGCTQYWGHPTKTTTEFYADSSSCEAMSYSAGSTQAMYAGPDTTGAFMQGWNNAAAIGTRAAQTRIYDGCMMGKGWRKE